MNIFTLNSGSSSLKSGVCTIDANGETRGASWSESDTPNAESTAAAASRFIANVIAANVRIDAVGHRVVFGGADDRPTLATASLIERLTRLVPYDPLHMPSALACLAAAGEAFPSIPHVVCYDTTFFREMPEIARQLSIPSQGDLELRRYGFHGLSYEYIRTALGDELSRRSVFAHLGSGASLAALLDGDPVETTMGFSAMGGLVMASRPGDIDPGVLLYLMENHGFDAASLRSVLETGSGLTAISGGEGDLHVLLGRVDDARARLAIDAFVRSVARSIGGLAAVLGGLDQVVFTGGIGEHLAQIRSEIGRSLQHLGFEIDESKNASGATIISAASSRVDVRVIPTDENMTIARHSYALLEWGRS